MTSLSSFRTALLISLCLYSFQCQGNPIVDLEDIVITPLRYESSAQNSAGMIVVLDETRLQNSNARTVVDALRSLTPFAVRDYYGNGTRASVDLRGFGEFSQMNTLVLIDGRRVNQIDLSGVDWTQIPLERVKKIEIITGSGTVLYGDNASGGVINLITEKGKEKPEITAGFEIGSYDLRKESFLAQGKKNDLSYSFSFTGHKTDGYRQNSDYQSSDAGARLSYAFDSAWKMTVNSNYHLSDYGLPGALRESQLAAYSRKESLFPNDRIGEEDWYIDIQNSFFLNESDRLEADISFRRKRSDNLLLDNKSIDGRRIDTLSLRPRYIKDIELAGINHTCIAGLDWYATNAILDEYSYAGMSFYNLDKKVRETDIDKQSLGYYLQDTMQLTDRTILSAGYRYEEAHYDFDSRSLAGPWTADMFWADTFVDQDLEEKEQACELGLKHFFDENLALRLSLARSFRMPATDEYFSVWSTPPVNSQLQTQISKTGQAGIDLALSALDLSLNFFAMNTQNELFYDPATYSNGNYDRTCRRGIDLFWEWDSESCLRLRGGYTYTRAVFDKGAYDGNQIPLVPLHKAMLGLQWQANEIFCLDIQANYTGEQYFINDQAHAYPRLDDYTTVDARLTFEQAGTRLFFGINNLFDEKYSEYGAISVMYNERGYYPSPGRTFIAGISKRF